MRQSVKWLIESDAYDDGCKRLIFELEQRKQPYKVLSYKECWDKPIKDLFNPTDCVIYYGSLNVSYLVKRENWIPGVYSDLPKYDCTYYYPYFGHKLINSDYIMMPYGDLKRQKEFIYNILGQDGCVFIRPNDGHKSFTGKLIESECFETEVDNLDMTQQINSDLLCLVSGPKNIVRELRFWISDNKIITGSEYKPYRHEIKSYDWEWRAAESLFLPTNYNPEPIWTLDICQTKSSRWYILEVGCFSCAGLYAANVSEIVSKVNTLAENDYRDCYEN